MSTVPPGNSVAVCAYLATFREPVGVNVAFAGSYSSALATAPLVLIPPAMSTFPLVNNVAVWDTLTAFMEPAVVNFPVAGS